MRLREASLPKRGECEGREVSSGSFCDVASFFCFLCLRMEKGPLCTMYYS